LSNDDQYLIFPMSCLTDDDFIPPSAYYFLPATGDVIFLKTRDRAKAQELCDEWSGVKGKYVIRAIKNVKTKSKSESGEINVRASNTRKCFAPRLKGLK